MPCSSMRGSTIHACALAADAPSSRARPPAAGKASRTNARTGVTLRYDDDITGLQHDVLLQIASARYVGVVERKRLLAAFRPAQDHDIAERGVRGGAAG